MEFKDFLSNAPFAKVKCINRIRLEFKVEANVDYDKEEVVLIESDWNLKEMIWAFKTGGNLSINRIRLEFKAEGRLYSASLGVCINRIRLEFKVTQNTAPTIRGLQY